MEPIAEGYFEEGADQPKRGRVRQVVYIYDGEDSNVDFGDLDQLRRAKSFETPFVTRCCPHHHCEKKPREEVSPQNPRIGTPGPIALFAFGTTVLLCNVAVAGFCPTNAFTACMAIFVGGLVQFVAGYMELVNKNTVGCIICTGYGSYNFVLGMTDLIPSSIVSPANDRFMGAFFFTWMFFAFTVLLIGLRGPLFGTALNICIVINFFLSAVGHWIGSATLLRAVGFEGIVAGSMAVYSGMAQSVNTAYQRGVFPLGYHDRFRNIRW